MVLITIMCGGLSSGGFGGMVAKKNLEKVSSIKHVKKKQYESLCYQSCFLDLARML